MGMFESEKEVSVLSSVYGEENLAKEQARYEHLATKFKECFGEGEVDFFSAPGRTEILGNHTDHNHGKVLTASIAMDTIAAARKNGTSLVHVISEGYKAITIDLENLDSECKCKGTLSLLIGMFECAIKKGYKVEGFDAYITTEVIGAAGVSSSASFEMLICAIMNYFSNEGKIDYVEYAKIGQYAEHEYWLKQSGLLDQMACAVGGPVLFDFADRNDLKYSKLDFSFGKFGHKLVIVNTGKGHADLSQEYSEIPGEMKAAAKVLGAELLHETTLENLLAHVNEIKDDRAILRAIHFFEETSRVERAADAIGEENYQEFLKLMDESGRSSWELLQNCYCIKDCHEQKIPLVLALTQLFLNKIGGGICRVHGGGFAGVIAAVVPENEMENYVEYISQYVGRENVYPMDIRAIGAVHIG